MASSYLQARTSAGGLDHDKIERPVHALLVALTKLIRRSVSCGDGVGAELVCYSLTLPYDEEPLVGVL